MFGKMVSLLYLCKTKTLKIMPNWCTNTITITGTKEQIGLLTRILEDEPKSKPDESIVFRSLIGIEPGISPEEYEDGAWYGSNTSYFGTKWDVDFNSCNFMFSEECITMSPETAWSPPINFGVVLHKMYGVSVELFYAEGGCDFCGKTIINDDGVFEEDYGYNEGHYHFDKDYFWEGLIESQIEYGIDEERDVEEFLRDFPYLSTEDREEVRKLYLETLKLTETNE